MDLTKASFKQIQNAFRKKEISAVEVTNFFLSRANKFNGQVNAYSMLNGNAAKDAEKIDKKIHRGESLGKLAGIPFGIKEMFCTKGIKTTAASKMLSNFIPPYDATVVSKLKQQDAIVLGKLNQDEFAMGSSNESSIFGACKNPWSLDHVPGGSSGGSAAAQAARMAAGTLGTDTGGSIRQPASFCGVVGVKPTYGRVSRYGIIAFASSLDQAGPIVSCVEDAAITLEAICGQDAMDSTTSSKLVPNWSSQLNKSIKGKKVAIIKEYLSSNLSPEVENTLQRAIMTLKDEGAEVVEVSIPLTKYAVPIYYLISASEASSNLARYDGVKYGYRAEFENLAGVDLEEFYKKTRGQGFGDEVKRRIMLGTFCLSSGYFYAYYNKACQVRRMLRDQFLDVFRDADVIVSAVTTTPAFKIGEKISNPLEMYYNDIFTVSANLAGIPSMSIPFGRSNGGLPIGVQISAKHFNEQTLLDIGVCLEASSPETWSVASP